MLRIEGKALEVSTREGEYDGRKFEVVTIAVMTGKADIERCELGRDFDGPVPVEGQDVVLEVVVSAFARRNGAGYRLTALHNVRAPERKLAATGS